MVETNCTLERDKDVQRLEEELLVGLNKERNYRFCVQVPFCQQIKAEYQKTWNTFTNITSSRVEVGAHHNEVYDGIASNSIEP